MRPDRTPLATVSLTFREASTSQRARVSTHVSDAAMEGLRRQGVTGLVELHTCARALWVVAADQPAWAGALVQSQVAARLGSGVLPAVQVGDDAARHALRVAAGLESFVEGEGDVGGQFAEAFAHAQAVGRSCPVHNLLRQAAAHLVAAGRERGFIRPNRGVGQLAVQTLAALGIPKTESVAVVGAGSIGQRVVASLRRAGWAEPVLYNRTPRPGTLPLDAVADHAHVAGVVCTAGPASWFEPPTHMTHLIDIGVPTQSTRATMGLDELLSGAGMRLSAERRALAEAALERELAALLARVRGMEMQRGLARAQDLRDQFMAEELERLFAEATGGLNDDQRRRVLGAARSAIRQYNHQMLTWLREEFAGTEDA